MTYYTFHPSNVTLTIKTSNYYRSSNNRTTGRYCYEFVWHEGTGYHLIGFTNIKTTRSFVGYYHRGGDYRFHSYPGGVMVTSNMHFDLYEYGMVCIDTSNANMTLINRTSSHSYVFPNYPDSDQWFACLDDGQTSGDLVSLNFGINPFVNNLPVGYQPWFADVVSPLFNDRSNCPGISPLFDKIVILTLIFLINENSVTIK